MLPSSYFWQGLYHLSVSSSIWLPCIHHRSTASHLNGYYVESWGPLGKWSWISCCLEQSSAEQFSASMLGSRNHSGDHRNVPVDNEKHINSHPQMKNSRKTLFSNRQEQLTTQNVWWCITVYAHIAILGIRVLQFREQWCNPKCIEDPHIHRRDPPEKG